MKIDYKKVVSEILASRGETGGIHNIYFAACGGSKAGLTTADFFLKCEAAKLESHVYTAKEFVLCPPKAFDSNSIVVTLSASGNTPEAVEAAEALRFAVELLQQTEGYEHYDEIRKGFDILDDVIKKAREYAETGAMRFAEEHREDKVLYVIASGANYNVAYTTTTCILMECQWIHSNPIHSGEFFHGPFEVVDKEVPFLVLEGTGRERIMDERAAEFLKKYGRRTLSFG